MYLLSQLYYTSVTENNRKTFSSAENNTDIVCIFEDIYIPVNLDLTLN